MRAFILTFFLMLSCTKKATINRESLSTIIESVQMDLSYLTEIEWNVGQDKNQKISQSFSFLVELPKLSESDIDYLIKKKNVDSWILRLVMKYGSLEQDLGSLYSPFKSEKISRGESSSSPTSVTLKVMYAAAYASQRFRAMKCPMFNHNKKIINMDILGENEPFQLMVSQSIPFKEKIQLIELSPTAFNAGNSLLGNYYIEIAPYNSKEKLLLSPFKRIPKFISVTTEESIDLKSCLGIKNF